LESCSRPNIIMPIVIPAMNSPIQAASTHRRCLTQNEQWLPTCQAPSP
jgi:hypothetical protein